jgi:concanavalin A-like lectin/glucanase superfamily protein
LGTRICPPPHVGGYGGDLSSEAWNGPGRIGGDPGGGDVSRTFNGVIDEVTVFNYALTPAQVLNLYNSASAAPSVTLTIQRSGPNLLLNWSNGTLQENTWLTGTWSAVTGAAPPSHTVTPSGTPKFYRVLVSN